MLVPAGLKVYTYDGYIPIEALEGKAAEISSLPYHDLQHSIGSTEPQLVKVTKAHSGPATGIEGMPLHPATNFLASVPSVEDSIDLVDSAYFLNSIQTYHVGVPACVTGVRVCPAQWLHYTVGPDRHRDAMAGIRYYAEGLNQALLDKLDLDAYSGEHTNIKFMSTTDIYAITTARIVLKDTHLIQWKFIDYPHTRVYYKEGIEESLARAFCKVGHLIGESFAYHDGKLKWYLPTVDTDKIDKSPLSHFPAYSGVRARRTRMMDRLNNRKTTFLSGYPLWEDARKMFTKGCWPGKLPSVAPYIISNSSMMKLPSRLKTIPLSNRKATISVVKGRWIPLEYFNSVQWYNIYSATPKLVFVESESGMLFVLSTIGGTR